jgi:hypothetical protein
MGAPFAMTLLADDPHQVRIATLLPKAMIGRSDANMAHAMAAAVAHAELASAVDAVEHLRRAFPQAPLRTRVAAAHILMERLRRASES